MSAEIGDLQRRLANLIRVGTIAEINRTTGRVKVRLGDVTTPWIPWSTGRAGAVKDWNPPAVGEQVTVVSPMGEVGAGFVMPGGINSDSKAPPDNRENVYRLDVPSGGAFEIHVGGAVILLDNGKCRITVGSKSLELNATKATWNGDLDVNGNINATGDVVAGTISLQNHTHTGVQPGGGTTGPPI